MIKDHPRRCGENQKMFIALRKGRRITPAGAGKTHCKLHLVNGVQDHPRRCGENAYPRSTRRLSIGSPPQVRGKRKTNRGSFATFGITPAGAGKTRKGVDKSDTVQDHPSRCGENFAHALLTMPRRGSPPQVRGKLECSFIA